MKRLLAKLIFCACVLLWVLLLLIGIEHLRGALALSYRINSLKSHGEVLSVSELEPRHPSPGQNTASVIFQLTNKLSAVVSNLDTPPSFQVTSPGHVIVAWQLREWTRQGSGTHNWGELGAELQGAGDVLDSLRASLKLPSYESGFDYQKGFVHYKISPVWTMKEAAQVLSAEVHFDLNRGRLDAAGEDLANLIKVVGIQSPEPLLISQLVRQACAAIAFNATWQSLQAKGWTDAQLASFQAGWEACNFTKDMARAMEMERAMNLEFYRQVQESGEELSSVVTEREKATELTGGFGDFPTHGFFLNYIHVPFWQLAWANQEQLHELNNWQSTIEGERLSRTNGWVSLVNQLDSKKRALKQWDRLKWYNRARFLFAGDDLGIGQSVTRKTLLIQTQQQMILGAIGAERYRLKNGHLPSELSALVPEFLKAVPRDGIDGKPLRYRLVSNGGYQLYSVGEDGKDNGGDPTLAAGKKFSFQIWDGRDAVWPAPASADEAEKALHPESKSL